MREVIVSEHLWGKIKEVNDYLINELHLSEEATEKRIRRMEQFVMDFAGRSSLVPFQKVADTGLPLRRIRKRLGIRLRGVRRRRDRARYGQYRTLGGITRYIHQRKSSEAGYSDGLRSPYPIAGTIYGPTKATEPQTAEKDGKRYERLSATLRIPRIVHPVFRPFFHHTTGLHNPAHLQCSIRGRVSSHTSAVIVTHTGQILYAVADRCSAS